MTSIFIICCKFRIYYLISYRDLYLYIYIYTNHYIGSLTNKLAEKIYMVCMRNSVILIHGVGGPLRLGGRLVDGLRLSGLGVELGRSSVNRVISPVNPSNWSNFLG